jgi:hypothetical protein
MVQENTYDLMVQETRAQSVHYGRGVHNRWETTFQLRPPYRPAREIPLSRQDACRCDDHCFEVAPHVLLRSENGSRVIQQYHREERRRVRVQALGDTGHFSTTTHRNLVEVRQARALAGIDVSEYDVEITRRILEDPAGWGRVGSAMRRRGWVDEVIEDGESYALH